MSETKLSTILKEATGDILTDDTLAQIERVFMESVDSKTGIHVEKALIEQDESHAKKLESLLEAIDDDHSNKLERVVEAIDKNHSQKLVQLVQRYEKSLGQEASGFKNSLVESISTYIEEYIDEKIPVTSINEAVKNKKAIAVLDNLRSTLGIDFALSKNTIKHAINEGKQEIDKSHGEIKQLSEQNKKISSHVQQLESKILLTEKSQELPQDKREYIFKVLSDKPTQFINENFDYTLRLFDRSEQERLEKFKKDAVSKRPTEVDRPILEKAVRPTEKPPAEENSFTNAYMSELGKY
mgnify:CR=1 FL=1